MAPVGDPPSVGPRAPGLDATMAAIAAIIAKATEMEHCIAVAVTDQAGELIASARMDDAAARWVRHARRKAYTAAIMGRSTKQLGEELRRRGLSVAEYGDHNITTLPGGAPILHRPTQARAAVGVAGNGGAEFDDTLAALGVRLLDDS